MAKDGTQRGGKRAGSGRKLAPLTQLKQAYLAGREKDAEYAFQLLCRIMRDGKEESTVRLQAAREVMANVWGKPAPRLESGQTALLIVDDDG